MYRVRVNDLASGFARFTVKSLPQCSGGSVAARWTDDGVFSLGHLPNGDNSEARAVSGDGSIIVGTDRVGSDNRAFIWSEQEGIRDLKQYLISEHGLNLRGWTLQNATGISADGLTIAGTGIDGNGVTQAWIATIPSPGSLPAVVVVFALGRWKRRR